jgi:hypothetical protein
MVRKIPLFIALIFFCCYCQILKINELNKINGYWNLTKEIYPENNVVPFKIFGADIVAIHGVTITHYFCDIPDTSCYGKRNVKIRSNETGDIVLDSSQAMPVVAERIGQPHPLYLQFEKVNDTAMVIYRGFLNKHNVKYYYEKIDTLPSWWPKKTPCKKTIVEG